MKANLINNSGSFYFIGAGGISMSSLAKYMLALKKKVGGSDISDSSVTAELKSKGVKIDFGDGDIRQYDTVVYTDAIKPDNRQLKLARSLNKNVLPRGKFLREVCRGFKKVTAVSGCHGKTTCTAMLANIYCAAGKKFMAHIGGMDVNLRNFYYSGNDAIITEACEYKKNFLALKPDIAVVLNTDFDHAECYKNSEELKECYKKFACRAETSVCLYGENIPQAITFGFDDRADYTPAKVKREAGGISFEVRFYGKNIGKISIKTYGMHNILNALAAIAAAEAAGICFDDIKRGLENFNGVERRMEKIGEYNGAVCIADYAHHPDEIAATVSTVKDFVKGELYVIFQPHTYSRTKNFFYDFVAVLSGLRHILIYRTFAAREYYDDEGSAITLSSAVKKSGYGESPEDIFSFIKNVREGDAVLFLGAGDIYFIAKSLINKN